MSVLPPVFSVGDQVKLTTRYSIAAGIQIPEGSIGTALQIDQPFSPESKGEIRQVCVDFTKQFPKASHIFINIDHLVPFPEVEPVPPGHPVSDDTRVPMETASSAQGGKTKQRKDGEEYASYGSKDGKVPKILQKLGYPEAEWGAKFQAYCRLVKKYEGKLGEDPDFELSEKALQKDGALKREALKEAKGGKKEKKRKGGAGGVTPKKLARAPRNITKDGDETLASAGKDGDETLASAGKDGDETLASAGKDGDETLASAKSDTNETLAKIYANPLIGLAEEAKKGANSIDQQLAKSQEGLDTAVRKLKSNTHHIAMALAGLKPLEENRNDRKTGGKEAYDAQKKLIANLNSQEITLKVQKEKFDTKIKELIPKQAAATKKADAMAYRRELAEARAQAATERLHASVEASERVKEVFQLMEPDDEGHVNKRHFSKSLKKEEVARFFDEKDEQKAKMPGTLKVRQEDGTRDIMEHLWRQILPAGDKFTLYQLQLYCDNCD